MSQPAAPDSHEPDAMRVGPWLAEPARNRLSREDRDVRVERKVMQLLVCLAADAGRPVTRRRLLDELWGYHVSDDALHSVVAKLRRAMDPDGTLKPIETVPKVGYRLVLPVAVVTPAEAPVTGPIATPTRARVPGIGRLAAGVAGLAALSAAIWYALAASPPIDLRATRLVPITSEPGLEIHPSLAPGPGDRVVYSRRRSDDRTFDLYVRATSGGPALQLTATPASELHPTWAHDASQIAFVRQHDTTCELWSVLPLGGGETRLAPCPGQEVASLSWAGPNALLVSARAGAASPFTIYRVAIATGETLAVTDPPPTSIGDVSARLSPDGRTMAVTFSPALGVQDLQVIPTSGGARRSLTADETKIHGFDWTPDGRSIVFSSNRTGLFGLWRVQLSRPGRPEHLAATADDLDAPSVSASGGRIAYERWLTETSVQRVPPADASSASRLLSFTRWVWHVDVAPRTGALAVVSDRSGSPELWTSRGDGSEPRQHTQLGGPYVTSPRWSPDGSRIAFVEGGRLRILDLATGAMSAATTEAGEARRPDWSADGRRLYFASNRAGGWQIWTRDLDTGDESPLTAAGGLSARVSRDGRSLFYSRPEEPGIWRRALDAATREDDQQIVTALAPVDQANWAVTPQAIFYVARDEDDAVLVRYDLLTGTERRLGPLPNLLMASGLAVSDDEQDVWFVRIDRQDSDIMLLERGR